MYGKLQKAIINFIKFLSLSVRPFVCPSVPPHGPTQLQLDGLLLSFYVCIFRKSVEKSQVSFTYGNNNRHFT